MTQNRHIRHVEGSLAPFFSARSLFVSRSAIVLVALLAMMLQSFVVQTHIHIPDNARFAGVVAGQSTMVVAGIDHVLKTSPSGELPVDKYPINEDPANCPLCHEFHHSGMFFAPTAAVLALPFYINFRLIALTQPFVAVRAVSHNWHGRAPPRI